MVGLLRPNPHAGSTAGWAMARHERFVHVTSIVSRQRAAKRRALKSLSGIARAYRNPLTREAAVRPHRRRSGAFVPTNEPRVPGVA
ncbi:hypothetical protein BBJ41_20585 [Burkholderia stabilis]|nr:hypothetical protein BBJ41_20585 [Burkholderia stabilis]HDR9544841.1 hypothetical protein [Burkholderia stabilis]